MSHSLRTAIAISTATIIAAFAPLSASATPALTSAHTNTPPIINGVRTTNEWNGPSTSLEFRWPGTLVNGRMWTQWSGNRLYLAADIDQGELASELDVVIDTNGDGQLQTGEPAYLVWASGRTQQFAYDASRRGFVQVPRNARREFQSASRRNGGTRTFEYAITIDPTRPVRIALKLERQGAPGQFDTWPTSGSRDSMTRNPNEWAWLTFTPSSTPTPDVADRTSPQISLILTPTSPTPQQEVSWYAIASDASGIRSIELRVNGSLVRSCTESPCETRTGPYASGTAVSAEAWAYDRNGNTAVAGRTIAVASTSPTDSQPPGAPQYVQVVNPGTGNSLFLFWMNPTDADFSKVRIYRSTVAGAPGVLVAMPTATPYTDTGLTEGTTYWYTIRSVDTSGNESPSPGQVSGVPRRP